MIIGGTVDGDTYPSGESTIVAEFRSGVWHQLGHLIQHRRAHGAVRYLSQTLVFGGDNLRSILYKNSSFSIIVLKFLNNKAYSISYLLK